MLLNWTTWLRRLIVPVAVFLIWTPTAYGWSWPVQGPVVQPYSYDESHPYAAGQHRGIDIGADATGETVAAPAAGTVSFAGSVPTNGKTVTIETSDGYSVTLTHLGSIVVAKGATVAEGDAVAMIGPSGTPEIDKPYVHLGIRVTTDPNGYVDPLSLLPPLADTGGSSDGSTTTQPVASGGSASSTPAPSTQPAPPAATTPPATAEPGTILPSTSVHLPHHGRRQTWRSERRWQRISHQAPVSQPAKVERPVEHHRRLPRTRVSEPVSARRRPVAEPAAPEQPSGLGARHEPVSGVHLAPSERPDDPRTADPLGLAFNGAAALIAVGAAFAAARRRGRNLRGGFPNARVLRLPSPARDTHVRRAA